MTTPEIMWEWWNSLTVSEREDMRCRAATEPEIAFALDVLEKNEEV